MPLMRLVCRECSATYEAPDTLFGAQPRDVRCNRCGFQWTVIGAVKAMPGTTPQPAAPQQPPEPAAVAPPELMRDASDSAPPASPTQPAAPPPPAPAVPPAAPGSTRQATLADQLAGPAMSLPAEAPAAHPPSTRSLLQRDEEMPELEMGDPEERRLSHELHFGETERRSPRPAANRHNGGRRLWLIVLLVIVLIVAAILFKPQILGAAPALGALYAAVGL